MLKYLFLFLPNLLLAQGASLLQGHVIFKNSQIPLKDVVIYMPNNSYSTSANDEGEFRMYYPNIDADSSIIFTCMSCNVVKTTPRKLAEMTNVLIEIDSLKHMDMSLGISDAKVLVQAAIDSIHRNYPFSPSAQVGFFRETAELDKLGFVKINEATIRIERFPEEKEVKSKSKILQSRKLEWEGQSSKVAAFGFENSALIVTRSLESEIPDFLTKRKIRDYDFNIDSLMVPFLNKALFAVSFEPKKANLAGGRIGKLFIDPDTKAIVRIDYDMTSKGMNEIFRGGLGSVKIEGRSIHSSSQYFPVGDRWMLAKNQVEFTAEFEERLDKKFKTLANFKLLFVPHNSFTIRRSSIRDLEEAMRTSNFNESSNLDGAFWRRENYIIPTQAMYELVKNKSK